MPLGEGVEIFFLEPGPGNLEPGPGNSMASDPRSDVRVLETTLQLQPNKEGLIPKARD